METIVCPAKVMLAGEYAVVDGGPAVVMAVDRHALARVTEDEQELSLFLSSARDQIAAHCGADSDEARAAQRVVVDTESFREGDAKLGLGSSAAATVAAIAAALRISAKPLELSLIHSLAARAHASAQSTRGAAGSGADVASAVLGGCRRFQRIESTTTTRVLELPKSLRLLFPWTGRSAATAPLVAAVHAFRSAAALRYENLSAGISAAAEFLAAAEGADDAVAAIAEGGRAVRALGEAAEVALWLPIHSDLSALAQRFGGALKPTGAGGGDLALAAFADSERASAFQVELAKLEILCPVLNVDPEGVRLSRAFAGLTE